MKNLLNTIVFKSIALFALVLLVAFAVTTSFNPLDQSNDIGGKGRDIVRYTPANSISVVDDIGGGGKGTSTTLKEDIGGSKGIKGEVIDDQHEISDIGGRNTNTTGNFSVDDIGGRNGTVTYTGGEFQITDICGRTTNTSCVYSNSDIGGRNSTVNQGNFSLALNNIGGSRDHVIIKRIPIAFTSEIGGKSTTIGQ